VRILFATYNPNANGSVMAVTRRQAQYLAGLGHRITVVGNEFPLGWPDVDFLEARTPDTPAWRFAHHVAGGIGRRLPQRWADWDFRGFLPQYRFSHAIAKVVLEYRKSRDVDGVICCQHFCAPGLVRVQRQCGIPFLLLAHGDIFSHPKESFPWPLRTLYRRTATIAYRYAEHVITDGSRLADRAVQCGSHSSKITVIPNGIDPEDLPFDPEAIQERKADCQLLFVGRLAPEKAVDVLIRAVAQLQRCVRLTIVGDGPCRCELESLVGELRLGDKVEFVGRIARDQLGACYRLADMVVLPSLTDAQPLVTLEALIAARPVIGTDVGGIPDVVKHNENGLLVSPGDPSALARAIDMLADDVGLRVRFGRMARRMAADFSWDRVLARFAATVAKTFGDNRSEI